LLDWPIFPWPRLGRGAGIKRLEAGSLNRLNTYMQAMQVWCGDLTAMTATPDWRAMTTFCWSCLASSTIRFATVECRSLSRPMSSYVTCRQRQVKTRFLLVVSSQNLFWLDKITLRSRGALPLPPSGR